VSPAARSFTTIPDFQALEHGLGVSFEQLELFGATCRAWA
jgi:hypothetical protein